MVTAFFHEGLAHCHMQNYELACQALQDVTVEWTGHGAQASYAMCLNALGDRDGAREILDKMLQLNDFAAAGIIYAALGDIENAYSAYADNDDWGH